MQQNLKHIVMTADPTRFSRVEFFARIEEAKQQIDKEFASVEELDQYIRNL